MKVKLLIIIFIVVIMHSSYAKAFEIYDGWDDDSAYFESIGDHNLIIDNDLYVTIYTNMIVTINYTGYHPYLPIYFRPWEYLDQMPAQDLKIYLCHQRTNGWYYREEKYCANQIEIKDIAKYRSNRSFVKEELKYFDYSSYQFNMTKYLNFSESNEISLIIEYKLPNAVAKQGDIYYLNLQYPNMIKIKEENFQHYLLFPSKDAVPLFVPDDVERDRLVYEYEKDKWGYKWGFKFKGSKDRIFWYNNVKEIENKQEELQNKYTWLSIKWGILFAILLLLVERLIFDWTPFGNQIFQNMINKFNPKFVIGNKENKVYHDINCPYINNIKKENREIYTNSRQARRKNLSPCKFCK